MLYRPTTVLLTLFLSCTLLLVGCKEPNIGPQQFGDIEGVVLDGDNNNEPLTNVSITTSPASNAPVTNGEGAFSFEELEAGSYSISARKSGYENANVSVQVREDRTANATIIMHEEEEDDDNGNDNGNGDE